MEELEKGRAEPGRGAGMWVRLGISEHMANKGQGEDRRLDSSKD